MLLDKILNIFKSKKSESNIKLLMMENALNNLKLSTLILSIKVAEINYMINPHYYKISIYNSNYDYIDYYSSNEILFMNEYFLNYYNELNEENKNKFISFIENEFNIKINLVNY